MDAFTRHDFEALTQSVRPWCVSLYLSTDRSSDGMLQTPIRLRNLATQAEGLLEQHGLSAPDAHRLLRPLRELPARAAFLKAVSEGLAIFVDDLEMQAFRLPYSFREQIVVGKRFHVKPLLPLLVGEGKFFLLAASANSVRMFVGDRWNLKELSVPGLPTSLREALNQDQTQSVHQVHTANFGGGSRMLPGFHGQGGRLDVAKDDLLEFFHIADRALRKFLADEQAPLVFAGVQYLFPIFTKACSYHFLAAESIEGNTDTWNDQQLHDAAWAIVGPVFEKQRADAVARCQSVAGTDYGLLQLDRVLQACRQGQVATLLIDPQQSCWGTFDPDVGVAHIDGEPRPGNEDLLNLAIVQTVQKSGKVFPAAASEMPDRSVVAAVLRYPGTAIPIPRPAVPVAVE